MSDLSNTVNTTQEDDDDEDYYGDDDYNMMNLNNHYTDSTCDENNNNNNDNDKDGLMKVGNNKSEMLPTTTKITTTTTTTTSAYYYQYCRELFRRHGHTVLTVLLAIALGITTWHAKNSSSSSSSGTTTTTTTTSNGLFQSSIPWAPLPASDQVIETVAFGSCMKQNMPQPFWDTLVTAQPQVTVLMGDQVYPDGDCEDMDCTVLKEAYKVWSQHPSFLGAKAVLPMVPILDDHDYGQNDCYESNPFKDMAKELFFDFYDIPTTDERRAVPERKHEGLYTYYEWGPLGQRVQLIVLDTRYSRSEFLYSEEEWAYLPDHHDKSKRMLSKAQWQWLEEDVLQRPANVRLVVSSVQVLTQGEWGFEHWYNIPHELAKLKHMLRKYCHNVDKNQRSLPLLLSGDRHIGAYYYDEENDLHEVTASSWTHTIIKGWDPDGVKCETDEECIEPDTIRVGDAIHENHFGLVQIDWKERSLRASLVRAETSHGYPVKQKWNEDTDAGNPLWSLELDIP